MATQVVQAVAFSVVNGPSKLDLMLALFDNQVVEFTVETFGIGRVKVRISSAGRSATGSDMWVLQGTVFQTDSPWGISHNHHQFTGSYNTRIRRGEFTAEAVVRGDLNSLLLLPQRLYKGRGVELFLLAEALGIPLRNGLRDMSSLGR